MRDNEKYRDIYEFFDLKKQIVSSYSKKCKSQFRILRKLYYMPHSEKK